MRSKMSADQAHPQTLYTYRQEKTHDTQAEKAGTHLRHSAVVKLKGLARL